MRLKDFFHIKDRSVEKEEDNTEDEVIECLNNQIQYHIDDNNRLREYIAELEQKIANLNQQIKDEKNTSNYKTGKTLASIYETLNNSQPNTFSFKVGNVELIDGKVYIDGKEQLDTSTCANKYIYIKLENPSDVSVLNTNNVTISGDANNVEVKNGNLNCGSILGNVEVKNGNIYRR